MKISLSSLKSLYDKSLVFPIKCPIFPNEKSHLCLSYTKRWRLVRRQSPYKNTNLLTLDHHHHHHTDQCFLNTATHTIDTNFSLSFCALCQYICVIKAAGRTARQWLVTMNRRETQQMRVGSYSFSCSAYQKRRQCQEISPLTLPSFIMATAAVVTHYLSYSSHLSFTRSLTLYQYLFLLLPLFLFQWLSILSLLNTTTNATITTTIIEH